MYLFIQIGIIVVCMGIIVMMVSGWTPDFSTIPIFSSIPFLAKLPKSSKANIWAQIGVSAISLAVILITIFAPSLSLPRLGQNVPQTIVVVPPVSTKMSGGTIISSADPLQVQGNYTGLSDGNFAFNNADTLYPQKVQASEAFAHGKRQEAEAGWDEIINQEKQQGMQIDAETSIYRENQQVLEAHDEWFTIIVGVVFNKQYPSDSMDILQGTYVAQKNYNDDTNHVLKMRITIANFGRSLADMQQVAREIVQAVQGQNRIMALVNLPEDAKTTAVLSILNDGKKTGNLPIVLSSGSNSSAENGGNIFHIGGSTYSQGEQAAYYVENNCPYLSVQNIKKYDCESSNVVVFMDKKQSYSYRLGQAFIDGLTHKQPQEMDFDDTEQSGIGAKINQYAEQVKTAPDLIYFAGDAQQARTFLSDLPLAWKQKSHIRVLGGDALYQPGKYSAQDYAYLSFTSFAYPDTPNTSTTSNFLGNNGAYATIFDPNDPENLRSGWYGYGRPDAVTMLAYDSLEVVIEAHVADCTSPISPDCLLTALRTKKEANTYKGITGDIAFDTDGNPLQGTRNVLLLRVFPKGNGAVAVQESIS